MKNEHHYQSNGFWQELRQQGRMMMWLAEQTGYTPYHLSRLKTGKEPITGRFVLAASRAIGVDPNQFFLPIEVPEGTIMVTKNDDQAAD